MDISELSYLIEYQPHFIKKQIGEIQLTVDKSKIEQALNWHDCNDNHHLISVDDPFYPPLLKKIADPPAMLFAKGQLNTLLFPSVAVVGSRAASHNGKKLTQIIVSDLCKAQIVICSGMAMGIDAEAHKAAINNNGQTLAVLGTGIDIIYPKHHLQLAENICQQGCVISEFWPNVSPYARNFPKRNRIISGISMGTVIIEAKRKSGSLITARLAMEQGRDVFAVPGTVLAGQHQGCHDLIKNGAKLIESAVDIIEELDSMFVGHVNTLPKSTDIKNKDIVDDALSGLPFSSVLASVNYDVTLLDEVVEHSGKGIEFVLEQMLELELQGWVAAVPGGYIRLKRN